MGASKYLEPKLGTSYGRRPDRDDGRRAWRISHTPTDCAIPVQFGSRRSVELAIAAIEDHLDWGSSDSREMNRRLEIAGGFTELKRKIADAQAW